MSAFQWSLVVAAGFPNPTREMSQAFESSTIRTQMESARTRQRQRFTSGFRSIPVSWEVPDALYGLFQGVLKYKLNNGASWFEISLPLGDGFETVTARFREGKFSASYQDTMFWKISATLEVEVDSTLTESEVNTLLGI